jgi:hypothetical protein
VGTTQPGLLPEGEPEEREKRTMTAARGKGADGGHVARAQQTDTPRTADRSRISGRPRASGRSESAGRSGSARRSGGADHLSAMERITVALIPKVVEALQRLQNRTNLSKTDLVNRALTLYEFFDAQLDADRDILIRDNVTQEIQSVMLL